jgi:hypothetical protein
MGGDRDEDRVPCQHACARRLRHTSHVQDLGNGMHSVTASPNWGGYTGSREETIAHANDSCGKSGQMAAIENLQD